MPSERPTCCSAHSHLTLLFLLPRLIHCTSKTDKCHAPIRSTCYMYVLCHLVILRPGLHLVNLVATNQQKGSSWVELNEYGLDHTTKPIECIYDRPMSEQRSLYRVSMNTSSIGADDRVLIRARIDRSQQKGITGYEDLAVRAVSVSLRMDHVCGLASTWSAEKSNHVECGRLVEGATRTRLSQPKLFKCLWPLWLWPIIITRTVAR